MLSRVLAEPLVLLSWLVMWLGIVAVCAWAFSVYQTMYDPEFGGRNMDIDFSVYWASAKLALEQSWLAPFDTPLLNETRRIPLDREEFEMYWLYPPHYLALILPLGTMEFFWAWVIWCAVSLLAFSVALRRPTQALYGSRALLLFAPSALMTLALGQNSLILAALMIAALEAIRREQHIVAGLLIAAMTIKPQLGLAIPIALMMGGHWRVILWACLGTTALLLPTLIFPGIAYWEAFFQGMATNGARMQNSDLVSLMISTFGVSRLMGLGPALAMKLQILVTLLAAGGLAWLWRTRHVSFDLKAAGLLLATLLMTPYAIHYELIFAVLAVFYLGRDGAAETVTGRYLICGIWLLPAIGYVILPMPGYGIVSTILFGAMIFTIRRAGVTSRSPLTGTQQCPSQSVSP